MILLTHFNGSQFYLNADIIQTVEATPDTVITLINNQKILVKEKSEKVVEKIITYQRMVHNIDFPMQLGDA
ncbi:MAG: flagellar FlbD family protein [Anaerolineae bacterium]|nr:flagellar FlbD family protein [Anaerolineae bacterium]